MQFRYNIIKANNKKQKLLKLFLSSSLLSHNFYFLLSRTKSIALALLSFSFPFLHYICLCVCVCIYIQRWSPWHFIFSSRTLKTKWIISDQCTGKNSGEESLWTLPSKTSTLFNFSSHQCNCSSLIPAILSTLDTTFKSISTISASIPCGYFAFRFLKHFLLLSSSLILIFFWTSI